MLTQEIKMYHAINGLRQKQIRGEKPRGRKLSQMIGAVRERKMSNKRAAELMGWVWVDEGDKNDWPLYYRVNNGVREFVMQANGFDPMTRWDHAGMLVEKLSEKFSIVIFNDSVGWYVDVYIGTTLLHEISADTAPEAITRAFIKAMEAK